MTWKTISEKESLLCSSETDGCCGEADGEDDDNDEKGLHRIRDDSFPDPLPTVESIEALE